MNVHLYFHHHILLLMNAQPYPYPNIYILIDSQPYLRQHIFLLVRVSLSPYLPSHWLSVLPHPHIVLLTDSQSYLIPISSFSLTLSLTSSPYRPSHWLSVLPHPHIFLSNNTQTYKYTVVLYQYWDLNFIFVTLSSFSLTLSLTLSPYRPSLWLSVLPHPHIFLLTDSQSYLIPISSFLTTLKHISTVVLCQYCCHEI